MLYCSNCQLLSPTDCPRCGRKARKMKEPKINDPVFLISCRLHQRSMITPVLEDNAIPYSCTGRLGAALATKFGSAFELYSIYVPYGIYHRAYTLICKIFGEDPEISARLESYGLTPEEIENTALSK